MSHLLRAIAVLLCFSATAVAHEAKYPSMWVGDLLIHTPVLRVIPAGAPVAGGYLAVENTGKTDEVLLGASAEFVGEVQLHEMIMSQDVMKMRAIEGGISVPAGATVRLEPGGLHLMLIKPSVELVTGAQHNVTLDFQNAGSVTMPFTVAPLDAIRELGEDTHGHGN